LLYSSALCSLASLGRSNAALHLVLAQLSGQCSTWVLLTAVSPKNMMGGAGKPLSNQSFPTTVSVNCPHTSRNAV